MNHEDLQATLDATSRDPKAAMNRVIEKRQEGGAPAPCPFSQAAIADASYVTQRDTVRARFVAQGAGVEEAAPARNDRAENLVDQLRYTKPAQIDAANLSRAKLAESPWSDDYWAVYLGILGKRYADPNFPASADWSKNHDYVRNRPAHALVTSGDTAAIDLLSPSEKYDLLIGDARGTLTAAMWAEGQRYFASSGTVETWMGICHGWAPGAFMLPRPRKVVTVLAADGKTKVRFYPSDVKALASLLWANAGTPTRFIGGRCGEKSPKTDENGRLLSPAAFDTNPGTWHQCVVNQIGAAKRSFVMDATYDYEVWNQPVFSYEYSYFNPKTMKLVAGLREGTIARPDFKSDHFRRYRTSRYDSIVGVAMKVKYVVETSPSHAPEDMPSRDALREAGYNYDLELDAQGTILGGEWYQNRHPDFLWTPPPGARAMSESEEEATGEWIDGTSVPIPWRGAAVRAGVSSTPLARIVERLIQLARAS